MNVVEVLMFLVRFVQMSTVMCNSDKVIQSGGHVFDLAGRMRSVNFCDRAADQCVRKQQLRCVFGLGTEVLDVWHEGRVVHPKELRLCKVVC